MLFWVLLAIFIIAIVIILFVYNNKKIKTCSKKVYDMKMEQYIRLLALSTVTENTKVNDILYRNLSGQLKTDNQRYMMDLLVDYINLRSNHENDAKTMIMERAHELEPIDAEFIADQINRIDAIFVSMPPGTETYMVELEKNLSNQNVYYQLVEA